MQNTYVHLKEFHALQHKHVHITPLDAHAFHFLVANTRFHEQKSKVVSNIVLHWALEQIEWIDDIFSILFMGKFDEC